MALPPGCSIDKGMELAEFERIMGSFWSCMGLVVILIYLVMAALFESYLLPLSVLTTIPLGFVGVYWSLYATGTPLDTISLIGTIVY